MDDSVYHLHYEQEEKHWWFAARAKIVREVLGKYGNLRRGDTVLDIGCGTGAILKSLAREYRVVGIDMSPLAVEYSRKRGLTDVFQMPVEDFPRDRYNVRTALLLDVLEHIDDDHSVLRSTADIIGPEGRLVITVPAYQWLWSAHDVLHHHKRRYTASRLRATLERAGLEAVKVSYFNTLLFPLAVVKKLLDRRAPATINATHLEMPGPIVNSLFRGVFAAERHIVPAMDLPFGVSLLAVARRKRADR